MKTNLDRAGYSSMISSSFKQQTKQQHGINSMVWCLQASNNNIKPT
jgi:hypothetical protein